MVTHAMRLWQSASTSILNLLPQNVATAICRLWQNADYSKMLDATPNAGSAMLGYCIQWWCNVLMSCLMTGGAMLPYHA